MKPMVRRELLNEHDNRPISVTLDTTVLLGYQRSFVIAAAHLRYFEGYWSPWIVAELVRKRTEWIGERAIREGADVAGITRRHKDSRDKINVLIEDLSEVLTSVDYRQVSTDEDLSWLSDKDDLPVIQTALAAGTPILVTDNKHDFPLGGERNGIRFMSTKAFLAWLYQRYPEAEDDIKAFLGK